MRTIILLGVLLVTAGVIALVFRVPKPVVAVQLASPVEPMDPAILSTHLQMMREEMVY